MKNELELPNSRAFRNEINPILEKLTRKHKVTNEQTLIFHSYYINLLLTMSGYDDDDYEYFIKHMTKSFKILRDQVDKEQGLKNE